MSYFPSNRWRGRLTVALIATVVPFSLGGTAAHALPSAQQQLATAATKAPERKVTASSPKKILSTKHR